MKAMLHCPGCARGRAIDPVIGLCAECVTAGRVLYSPATRAFPSGATRDTDTGKLDPEGFYSPLVVARFAEYMHGHRQQADGTLRDSDNWQRGMPLAVFIKSGWRHFLDWWLWHRRYQIQASIEDTLCAVIFNANGYLLELLKGRNYRGAINEPTDDGGRTDRSVDHDGNPDGNDRAQPGGGD